MTFNSSIRYQNQRLFVDDVPVLDIQHAVNTPVYIYSQRRILQNYRAIEQAFSAMQPHIHFSMKANNSLAILRGLRQVGAGIDAVSGGEIYKAIAAGFDPSHIVFAGVGKTAADIRYALDVGIGWFNVENVQEAHLIQQLAAGMGRTHVRIALRLNPDITANTHPHIATGHGAAKFGLTAEAIRHLLDHQHEFPALTMCGLHVHIGSNLKDTTATVEAIKRARELIAPYPNVTTLNIGGGMPVAYSSDEVVPCAADFAQAIALHVDGYHLLLEPGRAIVADAGILITKVLYTKFQGGQRLVIIDASMTELIRPMLYQAHHDIVPVHHDSNVQHFPTQVHGPVCETTDVMGRDVDLPELEPDDLLAVLTVGAYGSVMSSHYNARPRPAEVLVHEDGTTWNIIRRRESWSDLVQGEM
ncbi:diaminopimelate decarboxylase [Aggregatilineales bacterium SYSU G02658]